MRAFIIIWLLSLSFISCTQITAERNNSDFSKLHKPQKDSIFLALLPMEWEDKMLLDSIKNKIEQFYGFEVDILAETPLPGKAYYPVNRRYRADSLLNYLIEIMPPKYNFIVGLTDKDISCTEPPYEDWGVFGLGFMPGKSSVVSSFRLKRNAKSEAHYRERIYKVVLHEIGHNIGLDHCPTKNCMMQDAEGTIISVDNEKMEMCERCQTLIKELLK